MHIHKHLCFQLDKVYDEENPEDDMMERYEDMNRMREHVFSEVDQNRDRQISMEEFLQSTQQKDFDNEEEWDVCTHVWCID